MTDHLKPQWEKTKALFDIFSQRVLDLDTRFEVNPKKPYIGFNIDGKNVITVKPQASKILLDLLRVQPHDLSDPNNRTRYFERSYEFYHQHITQFDIQNEEDIEYALMLTKQVYKRFVS